MAITGPSSPHGPSPTARGGPGCHHRTVGDPYDNAVVESFWARLQVEVLSRRRWNTRIQLVNAIFEYIEGFHSRRRRHSALRWTSPIEFEDTLAQAAEIATAASP